MQQSKGVECVKKCLAMVFASDWTKYLTHDPQQRMRYASAKEHFFTVQYNRRFCLQLLHVAKHSCCMISSSNLTRRWRNVLQNQKLFFSRIDDISV